MFGILTFAVCAIFATIFNMHIFQLNSYKVEEQFKWIVANKYRFIPHALLIIVGIFQFCSLNVMGAIFVVIALLSIPKRAKKPLKYTPRVIRMLVTLLIIYSAMWLILPTVTFLCVGYALSPLLIIASNYINMPIEKSIQRYYINDAKMLLKNALNLTVIGITGSYGKTSVKYFLTSILRAKYNVLMTPESYNTPMGVVKTVRGELNGMHEIFVCEMGARYVGDIKEICDIVNPTHGIVTSIGPQHLETMKTIETIIDTKYELPDSLPKDGLLFLNNDNPIIHENKPSKSGITYGLGDADYSAEIISISSKGTQFTLRDETFATKLIGEHNVVNIVGAIAAAHTLGVPFTDIKTQVKRLESVPHRLELIKRNGITIIDDAYNSNPVGAKMALDTLALFGSYKILVTPGMVELGAKQDECNKEFGINAAKVCDTVVLVGEKQTKSIYDGLIEAGYNRAKIYVGNNLHDALQYVYAINCDKEKVVLLENDLPDNY